MSAARQKSPDLGAELAEARVRKAAALRILRGWPDRLRKVSVGDGVVEIQTSPDVCLQLAGLIEESLALRDQRAGVEDDLRRARLACAALEAQVDRQRRAALLNTAAVGLSVLMLILAGVL